MTKYCSHCGQANQDQAKFCSNCGAELRIIENPPKVQNNLQQNNNSYNNLNNNQNNYQKPKIHEEKSPALAAILSFLIVGIGFLYIEDVKKFFIYFILAIILGIIMIITFGVGAIIYIPFFIIPNI